MIAGYVEINALADYLEEVSGDWDVPVEEITFWEHADELAEDELGVDTILGACEVLIERLDIIGRSKEDNYRRELETLRRLISTYKPS